MRVSEHFKQALFYDQNSATDAFFDERASKLFQPDQAAPFIEVAFQTPSQDEYSGLLPSRVSDGEGAPGFASNLTSESPPQTPSDGPHKGHSTAQSRDQGAFRTERQKVRVVEDLSRIALVGFRDLNLPF